MRNIPLGRISPLIAAALMVAVASLVPGSRAVAASREKVLHSFCAQTNCPDGASPRAGLIMDAAGTLYGTTAAGGLGYGTVFALTPDAAKTQWTEKVLYHFCSLTNCRDGSYPVANLIFDGTRHLYGTTLYGGVHNSGTAFELTLNAARTEWTEKVLYSFCSRNNCGDGSSPQAGLIEDASGKLYGTTVAGGAYYNAGGTVFELP